jgi:hypothetical protein
MSTGLPKGVPLSLMSLLGAPQQELPVPPALVPGGVVPLSTAPSASTAGADGPRTTRVLVWRCQMCAHDCTVMRSENRCMCGHRFKEHAECGSRSAGGQHGCRGAGCKCRAFNFVMAEGAWILRCACKHKHTEHDANPPHRCTRCPAETSCSKFFSPWVCNCDHPWSAHSQIWEERELKALPQFDEFGDPTFVKRGLDDFA